MPCVCGDLYCWSCGPAQGNARCYWCGAWSKDGGCAHPEVCGRKQREADEEMAHYYEEREKEGG